MRSAVLKRPRPIHSLAHELRSIKTPLNQNRYPFESPVIRVLEGDEVIPTSILSGDDLLSLPGSDAWTPSSTIVDTLQDIVDMVLHANEAGLPTGHGGDDAGVS